MKDFTAEDARKLGCSTSYDIIIKQIKFAAERSQNRIIWCGSITTADKGRLIKNGFNLEYIPLGPRSDDGDFYIITW